MQGFEGDCLPLHPFLFLGFMGGGWAVNIRFFWDKWGGGAGSGSGAWPAALGLLPHLWALDSDRGQGPLCRELGHFVEWRFLTGTCVGLGAFNFAQPP